MTAEEFDYVEQMPSELEWLECITDDGSMVWEQRGL